MTVKYFARNDDRERTPIYLDVMGGYCTAQWWSGYTIDGKFTSLDKDDHHEVATPPKPEPKRRRTKASA